MAKGFKHGTSGGANPLNFQVKTYPSETELKADKPRENTIGVITTTTMTSWVFSATEPTEPEVGMVWISVGKASSADFNAIKKNTLQVYPLRAKQYVGGAFVAVEAMSYQNGEWVEWVTYLFKEGSGTLVDTVSTGGDTPSLITVTDNAITVTGNGSYDWCQYSFYDIDLSDYSLLRVDATGLQKGSSAGTGVGISKDGSYVSYINPSGERNTYNIDISTITGKCNISCAVQSSASYIVHNIWLER